MKLSPKILNAALAHEAAHLRHRDPLRIWLAGLATDLQVGARPARSRLTAWRHALELARDEEAREAGVTGPDLAAAILAVTRIERGFPVGTAALLEGNGALLRERIGRLLTPLVPVPTTSRSSAWWVGFLLIVAVALGVFGGEALVGGALR
jgi:beta-lactamase regulating signal transducer with metallopeptidase domain